MKSLRQHLRELEILENDIEKNELLITQINEQLLEASTLQDGKKIQNLSKELAKFDNLNEILFDDLEIQMDLFEKIERTYNRQIEEFER